MIPDKTLVYFEGAIQVMGWQSCTDPSSYTYATLKALRKDMDFLSIHHMKICQKKKLLFDGGDGRDTKGAL